MKTPTVHPTAFVADNATLLGDVTLGAHSSVFFGAVLRADREPITIGAGSNIQDNCVVHEEFGYPVTVGDNVTVGHGAILLNGAKIGNNCLIGAGALVPQNAVIPDGSLAFGSPARVKSQLDGDAIAQLRQSALSYQKEAMAYTAQQERR